MTSRRKTRIPLVILALGFFTLGIASLSILRRSIPSSTIHTQEETENCVKPGLVNFPAPEIQLNDIGLNQVDLKDYAGDVILLNTWATWCPPCRAEMPDLQTFYDRYRNDQFTLIAVNIGETQQQVLDFALDQGLSFPLWLDPQEQSLRAFNTISLPYSAVIDREGIVRYAWSGATCLTQLEQSITPLILQ